MCVNVMLCVTGVMKVCLSVSIFMYECLYVTLRRADVFCAAKRVHATRVSAL